jgi:transposase
MFTAAMRGRSWSLCGRSGGSVIAAVCAGAARRDSTRARAGARFALWKNPEKLTARQQAKLAWIEKLNAPLFRAYLLKEQLRQIYRLPADAAIELLDGWLRWARRCRVQPFVKLARTITDQRAGILAAIEHSLSNARVEAINTQIRLITRRAFGFHSAQALIALAMLTLADLCPPLPR